MCGDGSKPSTPPTELEPLAYGTSFGGRELTYYKLGNGSLSYAIIGGIHGGYEYNTVELVNKIASHLEQSPSLLPEEITLYIIPNANPDGHSVGFGGSNSSDFPANRLNGNNVDLNRNWNYNHDPTACWDSACSIQVSGGEIPFPEPETSALRSLINNKNVKSAIFYHSAMGTIFYGVDGSTSRSLATDVSSTTGYSVKSPLSYVTGDAVDWMSKKGLAGIEIELTNHSGIDWNQNLKGLKTFLNWRP